MKSKKKVLDIFNDTSLSNLVVMLEGHSFFNFFKGGILKKKFGPWLKLLIVILLKYIFLDIFFSRYSLEFMADYKVKKNVTEIVPLKNQSCLLFTLKIYSSCFQVY